MQGPPHKTRICGPPELRHSATEVETYRGAGCCRWAQLTTLPLSALGRAGSRPRTPEGPPKGPVGAAKERRMKESASRHLGPQISFRHEPAPQTSLCRFFRSEVRSNSNQIAQIASRGTLLETRDSSIDSEEHTMLTKKRTNLTIQIKGPTHRSLFGSLYRQIKGPTHPVTSELVSETRTRKTSDASQDHVRGARCQASPATRHFSPQSAASLPRRPFEQPLSAPRRCCCPSAQATCSVRETEAATAGATSS